MRPIPAFLTLATTAVLAVPGLGAQETMSEACTYRASGDELLERASPPDSASVTLGDESVKVCYSSPRARDREIMGGLVPYGELWRLGANEPTLIYLPFPAELGGRALEAGSYSIYTIPREDRWTFLVSESVEHWGRMIDEDVRSREVAEFDVEPGSTTDHVENFTIRFEESGSRAATMVVEWERTRLEIPLRRSGS